MPKPATSLLIWSQQQSIYIVCEQGQPDTPFGENNWFAWLTSRTSFSFQGKEGHINLQKEKRPRGEDGYWYAFRRQGKMTRKKYAGRTLNLSIPHLENIAQFLSTSTNMPPAPDAVPLSSSQHQMPLLASKLQIPRLPDSLIRRSRLLTRLEAGQKGKLTLLSAHAGSGKTMLVRQWIYDCINNKHTSPSFAWVTLDPDDNDPLRFWRYLITACQIFHPGIGPSTLPLLNSAFAPRSLEVVITTFLNELALISSGILVLDSYHVITSPQIQKALLFFLNHLPTTLHVLIITRTDPPFSLAHLLAHHDLCEIRANDLRFSPEETHTFLQQTLPLSSEMIAQCDTLLEGWATGLHLFSLLLQTQTNPLSFTRLLETFTRSNQAVIDYFVNEVLSTQSQEIQHILLHSSMLSCLCGPLYDAITGRNDSASILTMLANTNLFLLPLDNSEHTEQWYRYHPLFARAMQHEAQVRFGIDAIHAVAVRASQWFEQQGMFQEAINTVGQTGDLTRLTDLVERMIDARHSLENNEFHTLRRWLEKIPETQFSQRPLLAFYYALALVFAPGSDYLVPETLTRLYLLLQIAEEHFRQEGDLARLGKIFTFRALLAGNRGALRDAGNWARQALAWLPAYESAWLSTCWGIVGEEARYAGQLDTAYKMHLKARALSQTIGNRSIAQAINTLLGEVCFEQGMLHMAAEYYRQALSASREQKDLNAIGAVQINMAWLLYEWNSLIEAEQALQEAAHIGTLLSHEELQIQAALLQARINASRGQIASAGQTYASLLVRLQAYELPLLTRDVLFWQARLQLALGNFSAVHRWIHTRDQHIELPLRHQEREELLVARLLFMEHNIEESLEIVLHLLQAAHKASRLSSILEIQTFLVQIYTTRKQRNEARELLFATLTQAQTEGYIRLFLDEGNTLITLLRPLMHQESALRNYIQMILQTTSQEQKHSASQTISLSLLSPQEQRVLRLLATGASNPEIAQTLIVSVTTVRTQLQSIYRKLGVNNRVAASEMARRLQIL